MLSICGLATCMPVVLTSNKLLSPVSKNSLNKLVVGDSLFDTAKL